VGFVFGMTGIERGALVHWSDMLAVREGCRTTASAAASRRSSATRCARSARRACTGRTTRSVARNAHFNLNRLGARVSEYVPDMYGTDTGSAMHSGFGTDRFIVVWPIAADDSPADVGAPDGARYDGDAPCSTTAPPTGATSTSSRFGSALPPVVRVEIPPDIFRVQGESVARAIRWRATTRHALPVGAGQRLHRAPLRARPGAGRGFYRLARG
jgi:predicted GNAT superfamily acetyltransferase